MRAVLTAHDKQSERFRPYNVGPDALLVNFKLAGQAASLCSALISASPGRWPRR